ncbi:class I SAM-dependent methyltransferase [Mycobacterium sp. CnD-18-1]|uniref:class I SAM-dependent methyltransferase n=1 Tax=Mycobacterium sp. CnD-18-1 TaxID=2917744 RepID=UPI001EF2DFF3|nr:class I SAM-dependent methyltransferase [Mycobacterium sp. CnD-18-1]MCG7607109.1 class I SAM-dependent methyltransferase [Mycobacterium sp. CnD-18-1]
MVEALMESAAMERLAQLAAEVPADQVVVEVGTYQAANLVNMALAAKRGHGAMVHGVDPYGSGDIYRNRPHMLERYTDRDFEIARDHIKANHVVRQTKIHIGTSVSVAETWDGPKVGLLVIDGEHRYQPVLDDFYAWAPHLAENAVVVFDDYGGKVGKEVVTAVAELVKAGRISEPELVGTRMAITGNTPK